MPSDATWGTVKLAYAGRRADLVAVALSYDEDYTGDLFPCMSLAHDGICFGPLLKTGVVLKKSFLGKSSKTLR